jgi:hypothetical protein
VVLAAFGGTNRFYVKISDVFRPMNYLYRGVVVQLNLFVSIATHKAFVVMKPSYN